MRVVYVSYDGALDPLGASQVVPYLVGLAGHGVELTLLSFEKPGLWADVERRSALETKLEQAGIRWRPQRYHKRPRLPATLFDLVRGVAVIRREVRERRIEIVHGRGEVATTMARLALVADESKLLYDIRGFFADERADSGSWTRGGAIDRLVRRAEARNLARADAIVVLTHAALRLLEKGSALPPHQVIPTCVDLTTFAPRATSTPPEYGPLYLGSFGPRYLPAQTIALGRRLSHELGARAIFVTPHVDEAVRAGATTDWADVRAARPDEVPRLLNRARLVFFLYQPGRNTRATSPTRLGEALAVGLPVVTNEGVGDVDAFLEKDGVGVLVRGFGDDAFAEAALRAKTVLDDPETAARCRHAAETRLGVELGVARYLDLYRMLAS